MKFGTDLCLLAYRLKIAIVFNLMINPLRFKFKKLRVLLAWIGGTILVLTAQFTDASFRHGLPLVILGELIRVYASGYLEKKGRKLATSGPFAYVRNPLYLGSFILGTGIIIMANNIWMVPLFLTGFLFVYAGTVRKEEQALLDFFGEPYEDYRAHVPRFIPSLKPYPQSERQSFKASLLVKHREYITIAGVVMMVCGFYIIEELNEDNSKSIIKLQISAALILLAIFVLIFEWIRKEVQKKDPD